MVLRPNPGSLLELPSPGLDPAALDAYCMEELRVLVVVLSLILYSDGDLLRHMCCAIAPMVSNEAQMAQDFWDSKGMCTNKSSHFYK